MRRIFASGSMAGFVLSFIWIPSPIKYSAKGSRFFDRDYDPSKSLLHVFAQRLAWTSLARRSDQDCFSPCLMHVNAGELAP